MLAQDSYEGNNYYCMVLVSKLVLGVIGMEAAESPRLLARLAGGEEAPGPPATVAGWRLPRRGTPG